MPERSRDWLRQAERDLKLAEWAAKGGFHEWACFAAQQAAEKGVKAVYEWRHGEARGHSVRRLLDTLPEADRPGGDLVARAAALDRFYVPTRYPNGFSEGAPEDYYTEADSREAIVGAREIVEHCRRVLSG